MSPQNAAHFVAILFLLSCATAPPAQAPVPPSIPAANTPKVESAVLLPPGGEIELAPLAASARAALAKVMDVPVASLPPVSFVDDDAFEEAATAFVEALLGGNGFRVDGDYLRRTWIAVPVGEKVVARRTVGGDEWAPNLAIEALAAALAEPQLPQGSTEFDERIRWGASQFYGQAAALVANGAPPVRALLHRRMALTPSVTSLAGARFGRTSGVDATAVAIAVVGRQHWIEAAFAEAAAIHAVGGRHLLSRWLSDPPRNVRQLASLTHYANGEGAAALKTKSGAKIPFVALDPFRALTAAGFSDAATVAGTHAGGYMLTTVEYDFLLLSPEAADTVEHSISSQNRVYARREMGKNLSLFGYTIRGTANEIKALIDTLEVGASGSTKRWNYVPQVPIRPMVAEQCAFQESEAGWESPCTSSILPKGTGSRVEVQRSDASASAAREGTIIHLRDRADRAPEEAHATAESLPSPHYRRRRHSPAGVDSIETLSAIFPICGGRASIYYFISTPTTETRKLLAVEKKMPSLNPGSFCTVIDEEDAYDFPPPQIPPGLLVARP